MSARGRRTWRQRLVLSLSSSFVVAVLLAAGVLGYAYSKYSRLARVELGTVLTERASPSEPQNLLIVGVDSAANLDVDDPVRAGREGLGGLRSDSMMVLRVDPAREQADLLSIPRDLWVPLASGGRQRINTAIEIGGPTELVATIEGYLGIPIHHYVQVDFAAFRDLIDVIGGVEVWFDHPVRDQGGLHIAEPGCVLLASDQALAYVRARTFETFVNGRWRTDPTGDHGRMSRQQDFVVRSLRRAVDRGVRNPVTLDRLIDAGLAAVTVDDLWTADDMAALASHFRGFDPDQLVRHSLPVADERVGGADVLRLRDGPAKPVLDVFRSTDGSSVEPSSVRVAVLNGTGQAGQAATVRDGLAAAGFGSVSTGEAERFDVTRTVVRHNAGHEAAADLVARHLETGAVIEEVTGDLGADIVIVTGADYAGVRATPTPPRPSSSTTEPGADPTSPGAASPAPTTTTTAPGNVPQPPPGVDC